MVKHFVGASILLFFAAAAVGASDLRLHPSEMPLTGPHAFQRLLVADESGDAVVADLTDKATFASADTAVATVDAGVVRPVGDGETTITATVEGRSATAKVKVAKTKEPADESFRNHVIPMLTKIGCNSGACHGALAGKGGMKLSLRGYDPAADHFVFTRQALGRRVDDQEPEKSLMLLKPTKSLPHGGGKRFGTDSPDYRLLLDWIKEGAAAPADDDVRIQRIEVFPPAAVLKPEDKLQMIIRAWYSDGHAEEVTRWAKFNSSEDLVATVDHTGKVRVAGHGEAAITVWYSNFVATSRIASPLENSLDAKLF